MLRIIVVGPVEVDRYLGLLVDNLRWLVEEQMIRLPLEPDMVRRCFLNVAPDEDKDGYVHASRELMDVFDAIGLAATEMSTEQASGQMEVLTAQAGNPSAGGLGPGGSGWG